MSSLVSRCSGEMGVIARAGSPGDQQTHQFRPWAALSGERVGPWWVNIRPYPSSKRLHFDFKSNNIGIFTGNRGDCPFVALRSTDMTVGDSKAGFPVDDFLRPSSSMNGSVRLSVCLSVRLSVRHTFLTMFLSTYHHEIFRSYYQWQKWRPCKRSRPDVKGQGHRGHDPT